MASLEYIKNKQESKNHFKAFGIEVWVKDSPPESVSVKSTVKTLVSIVPKKLLSNIRFIHIGDFKELNDRKIQALYRDSTIVCTNKQSSNEDLLDDLVHEVAHSVEEIYGANIYSDKQVEKEFLAKRKKMWISLKNQGFEMELDKFLNVKYNKKFDMFLYKKVGYPLLSSILSNLFYSPYGATSLREYFANGFEAFFMKRDIARLKNISPVLIKKITELS